MSFGILREEDQHFVAQGARGEFRIAKSRLYPATVERFRGMCRGGKVEKLAGGGLAGAAERGLGAYATVMPGVAREGAERLAAERAAQLGERAETAMHNAHIIGSAVGAEPPAVGIPPDDSTIGPGPAKYAPTWVDPAAGMHTYRWPPQLTARPDAPLGSEEFAEVPGVVRAAEAAGRGMVPGFDYPVAGAHYLANRLRGQDVPWEQVLAETRAEHDRAEAEHPFVAGAGGTAMYAAIPFSRAAGVPGMAARAAQAAATTTAMEAGKGRDALEVAREAATHDAPMSLAIEAAAPWVGHLLGHVIPGAERRAAHPLRAGLVASHEEARDVAAMARRQGGFTGDPARNRSVSEGYALSTRPDLGEIRPDVGANTLEKYMNQREGTFLRDPQAVAGGWRNPETGKWELDVSKVIPDREEALRQGAAAHQKAIYDLGRGEAIPVPGSGFGAAAEHEPVLSAEQLAQLERSMAATPAAKPRKFARGGEVPRMADGGWAPPTPPAPVALDQLMQQTAPPPPATPNFWETDVGRPLASAGNYLAHPPQAPVDPLSTYTTDQIRQAAGFMDRLPPQDQAVLSQALAARGLVGPGGAAPGGPPMAASHFLPGPGALADLTARGAVPGAAGGPAATASPIDPYQKILGMMQPPTGALRDIAKAEQTRAQGEAAVAQSQASWAQEQMKWYQDARSKIDADYAATVNDYRNQQIDPLRVFHDRTAAQKATAMAGMLLGGIGSALTGQPNLAAQMIQQFVERDLEAQVRTMDQKKNLVAMNFERYGNLDQAIRTSYAQQTAFFEAKLHGLAATSTAAEAMPRAQMAAFQLRQPLIPIMAQIAQYQGLQNMIRSGGHVVGDMPAPWSWDQYMATAMPGPGGRTTFARSPEDRKTAVEGLQKWDAYQTSVDQLDQARSALAALPVIPTEAAETYKQHREAVILHLANAMGTGRGEAFKAVQSIVPDSLEQFLHSGKSLDTLRDIGANGKWSIWESHGSLHRPALRPLH